jgi:hypothetical protein
MWEDFLDPKIVCLLFIAAGGIAFLFGYFRNP